jgi:TonB family protein
MIDQALWTNFLAYAAQIAGIAAIGTALHYALRLEAPWLRHGYWRCLLVACLLLPLTQTREETPAPVSLVSPQATVVPAIGRAEPVGLTVSMTTGRVRSDEPIQWPPIVAGAVATGCILRLLWTAIGLWQLRRLRQTGEPAVSPEHDELQRALGTRAAIRYTRTVDQPVTFGFWRPVVVLPEALRDHPVEIQRAVVAHELYHVRRADWLWLLTEELVRAAFWFHPAVWWLTSRIQLTREEVVDAAVVRTTGERRVYLEALMAFADAAPLTPAAAFSRRRHLFTRMVLLSKEAVMSSQRIVMSCVVAALIVGTGSWYAAWAFPLQRISLQVENPAVQGSDLPRPPSVGTWHVTVRAQQRSGGAVGSPQPGTTATAPRPGQRVGGPGPVVLPTPPAAGPLERQAKPITPENPIPRRTYSVPVELPAGASEGFSLSLPVRATLDQQGRVAEARLLAGPLSIGSSRAGIGTPPPDVAQYGQAAIDAIKQWQYEPPADAPISFDVQVSFNGMAQPVATQSQGGSSLFAGGLTARDGALVAERTITVSNVQQGPSAGLDGLAPVRVGGQIRQPVKTRHVNPDYPALAQSARVQGVVILETIIGTDGKIVEARVLRSIPLLDQAAIDAVRQWEFTPTLLNGQPHPVVMTVTVQFTLPEPAPPVQ